MQFWKDHITRRAFCGTTLATVGHLALAKTTSGGLNGYSLVVSTDRPRILNAAKQYITIPPKTITSFPSSRSPGGLHEKIEGLQRQVPSLKRIVIAPLDGTIAFDGQTLTPDRPSPEQTGVRRLLEL